LKKEFKVGDKQWVKLRSIKDDGKISFTMKGIDQATGKDLRSTLANLQIGEIFWSTIVHIKDFGFFIKIETNQG